MSFSWNNFVAGWGAGAAGLLIGYAADTVKVQQQVLKESSTKKIMRSILRNDGITGFYKGLFFPLISAGTLTSIFFGVYANTLSVLQRTQDANVEMKTCYDKPINEYWHHNVFAAGCLGGLAQFFIACPVDIVKIKLQAQNPRSISNSGNRLILRKCVSELYEHTGWKGFFRGGIVMMIRDIPSCGVFVLAYEHILSGCRLALDASYYPVPCQLMAGGLAGALSCTVVLPLDLLKSRLQADCVKRPEFNGMVDCAVKSYKTGGSSVFFRGFWLVFFRAFPVSATSFVTYEWLLAACKTASEYTKEE